MSKEERVRGIPLTKIIATVGPATERREVLERLIREGARAFRFNFSHGDLDEHARLFDELKGAADAAGQPVAVIGDLPGPKIRIGEVVEAGVELETGNTVLFQSEPVVTAEAKEGEPVVFSTNYPELVDEVEKGQRILVDDGNVELVCREKLDSEGAGQLVCEVVAGGRLTSRKGVNLPDTALSAPSLTDKDLASAAFAVDKGFDYLALSFVRSAKDVLALKDHLRKLGARPSEPVRFDEHRDVYDRLSSESTSLVPVIAKIEKPQAIEHLEDIVAESDAVMVARGDLGVEMDLAEVAVLQKVIVALCREQGKPVIVATQMLQSMVEDPSPTRAEVSDVANAIFDGVDAVMLSGETAVGSWPVEAVRMMNRIAVSANTYHERSARAPRPPAKLRELRGRTPALAHGVSTIVRDMGIRILAMWSPLGGGAVHLSQQRLPCPVVCFSPRPEMLRRMALLFGLTPIPMSRPKSSETFIQSVDELLRERGWAEADEPVVIVFGEPMERTGITNQLCVHYLGELDRPTS